MEKVRFFKVFQDTSVAGLAGLRWSLKKIWTFQDFQDTSVAGLAGLRWSLEKSWTFQDFQDPSVAGMCCSGSNVWSLAEAWKCDTRILDHV